MADFLDRVGSDTFKPATKSDVKAVIREIRTEWRKCKRELRATEKRPRKAFKAVKTDYWATKSVLRKLMRDKRKAEKE